jgi:hypothetical protein
VIYDKMMRVHGRKAVVMKKGQALACRTGVHQACAVWNYRSAS